MIVSFQSVRTFHVTLSLIEKIYMKFIKSEKHGEIDLQVKGFAEW